MDAAFLTDDCDLNLYQHHDQAEYSATDNTTFHIYQAVDTGGDSTTHDGTDGDAYAVAYDHDTGNVIGPHRIGMNPLNAEDTHGVPAMTIDGDGYIHVFFGNHGGWNTKLTGPGDDKIQYSRSENPYDITSWIYPPDGSSGAGPLSTPRGTYTCATYDPGTDAVYVLYRAGNGSGSYPSHDHATLATSSDNGNSWTDINNGVLDFTDSPWVETCAYVSDLGAWAGRIHLTWTVAESDSHGQPRKHIYHAAYNPSTGNMETMSGTNLGSEVSWANADTNCKVKDTGDTLISGDSARTFNHAYDAASDTAYIPARYPVDSSTSQLRLLSYQGVSTQDGTWQESGQITTTSNSGRPSAEVRVNDSGEVEITDQGGQNGLWRRENGTWNHYDYVAGTPEIDKIQRPVQNGIDEFGWFGRAINSDSEGAWRSVYALGFGQPSGAGATPTRAPKNLRVTSEGSDTATIDWDDGIAGPSGVSKYKVYVDGSHQKDVTTQPTAQPYPRTWTTINFGGGTADVEVSLVNNDGTESGTSNTVTVGAGGTQAPYGGTPWSIPGQIQAEDYDTGGEGVAYHDDDAANNGGEYRSDGVDIETNGDTQGSAYNVGYTNPDEWLEYTVDVDNSGTYDLDLRIARNPTGSSSMHVEMDGTDVTGTVSIPNTGGWQTYQTVTVTDVSLSAGQHVMRVYFDGDGINLNYVEWSSSGGSSSPTPVTHYQFDEASGASTATDSAGSHDATINGGVTTGVTGRDGSAYDFDGSSTATVVDGDADNYINGLSAFSVACWVQSDSTGNDRGIFNGTSDGGDSADSDVCLRYDSTGWQSGNSNCLKAGIRYDDGGTIATAQIETEGGLQTTNWQHVVYTWAAGDQIRVYVDGSEVTYGYTQSTPSGATIAEQTAFAVGEAVHTNTWDGKIDDVRVYDQALSATEVSNLYNSY